MNSTGRALCARMVLMRMVLFLLVLLTPAAFGLLDEAMATALGNAVFVSPKAYLFVFAGLMEAE